MTKADAAAFDSANRRALANGHADGGPFPFLMLDELRLDHEVFWLIDEVLPRGSMLMVYARGGAGKTYLLMSTAIGLACGRWFNHHCEPGAVLYCAFERPGDAADRLAALRDRLRIGLKQLPLALLALSGECLDEGCAERIVATCGALSARTSAPMRAVVIDTVAAALGTGKEDDDGLGRLRMLGERIHAETGAMVIWVHHEGKADHVGPRGHLRLADACLVWWRVEEREDGSRVVHVDKANRGPVHQPLFAYRLEPFEAGRDKRGRPIMLAELQLVDLEDALASKARARFGAAVREPKAGLGSLQRILMEELRRLAARHPGGVEDAMLRSHFIARLHALRQKTGKGELKAADAANKYRHTLTPLIDTGRISRADGDRLMLGDDE